MRTPLSKPPAAPPKVLVVGGGPFQLDIIRTAKEIGAIVAVADKSPTAPGFALADHAICVDIIDVDAMVEAARAWGANGVVTAASDAAVPAVAAIGDALGLIAVPIDAARRCRDKLATFETLKQAELEMPRTICVRSIEEARDAIDFVGGYPFVIKPRSAAGGRGVAVVREEGALAGAFDRAGKYDPGGLGTLIQTFVPGIAIGVEAFFWRGSLAAAFVMDDQFVPDFVSPIGHSFPSAQPEAIQRDVTAAVARFARALGLREGPANFDLRFTGGKTVLLEVNARLGGNSITDLVRRGAGVDLSAATVRAAMGQTPDDELRDRDKTPTAVRLILGPASDRPLRVKEQRSLTDKIVIDLTVKNGEPAALRVDEHAIFGRVITHAETASEAALLAEQVANLVAQRIEVT
jgi:biotin carboxylase